jgi:hypothetical protein
VLQVKPEDLSAEVNKDELKVFTAIAERLITAEEGLLERVLELQAATESHRAAEIRWASERNELVAEVSRARQDAAARIAQVETDAAAREGALSLQLREKSERVAQQQTEIAQLRSVLAANGKTISELRTEIAGEGGRKLAAGFLGLLGGPSKQVDGYRGRMT